jgi:5'-deoxynucleotidase YfbR-like HD superfamily hydrolase
MRWSGASKWEHPLSVAQHSLTVLAIREAEGPLTPGEARPELLHDVPEFMLGLDCITPLKAQLGKPFRDLEARLQRAIDTRYQLPQWTPEAYAIHKRADRLARNGHSKAHTASCKLALPSLNGDLNDRLAWQPPKPAHRYRLAWMF